MKIINLYLLAMLLPVFSWAETSAKTESMDYKCYIESSVGNKVLFYRWPIKELELKVASLPGKQFINKKGRKIFIQDVEECVRLDDVFTSNKAQKQDKLTLR
ncbi:TapY2 family type IVa secretion system protein [Shewanella sp. KX20019]|uniref:TapY2 family type IVa secretion system protein n=1 Tax=Shewanella sp. KX20019 TaxID=2803864 RepID=UPI0019274BB3|nr:TapY2 family type IVa secretion system protein [Shewanella sp. KX20019]QQX81510.1 TapY2 family type IVa secretion system protein [Shewanella sp. KX20019]